MKVALYARVSTKKQSVEAQIADMRDFCQRRGWQDIIEFTDTGCIHTQIFPGRLSLLDAIRNGGISHVLVYKIDRLGRDIKQVMSLIREFKRHNVILIATSQGVDTSDEVGYKRLDALVALAQFERELASDRIQSGLRNAKNKGVKLGRPETLQMRLPEVQQLVLQGKGARIIARELQIPLSSTSKLIKQIHQNQPVATQ